MRSAPDDDRPGRVIPFGKGRDRAYDAYGHAYDADEARGDHGAERRVDHLTRFMDFLRRRVAGDYEVDEFGFDPELTDKVTLELMRPLYRTWFRVETLGAGDVPAESGALIVANHSGTLPLDALMLQVAMHDEVGRPLRLLGADLVYQLPVLNHLARKTGHTLACREDADRLLRKGEAVGVFPEGFKGVGKPFSERYRLQRFGRGGFVASAIRAGVPIVPCAIVGAEEIYPKIGDLPVLARILGLPYLPITPLFPWFGPLGLIPLPSKWMIEFGEPIRTDDYDPGAADDPMLVFNLTDHVREIMQQMLNELRLRRGHAFPPLF
ncbi:1-acyl-sn-glycerol-3-phosphate acyltransferase [Sinosporangium album]|uniref:1-acyl-sn-glycerol-3-phosphate acyltransferase n=1 Tax=Sinosporangium album TaxID=504805 RepID=A0A1G7U893_9ACTN|nr:lysophospholipid acyltransferase family protein [Sinosporangium album]SDG43627.1 1-acyl-sn-glycerol-3-phosphate acyltransferase [Sinosporangium album]